MSILPNKALSSKTDSLNVPVIVLHVMLACHCLYRERERDASMPLSVQGEREGGMVACHCLYREREGW